MAPRREGGKGGAIAPLKCYYAVVLGILLSRITNRAKEEEGWIRRSRTERDFKAEGKTPRDTMMAANGRSGHPPDWSTLPISSAAWLAAWLVGSARAHSQSPQPKMQVLALVQKKKKNASARAPETNGTSQPMTQVASAAWPTRPDRAQFTVQALVGGKDRSAHSSYGQKWRCAVWGRRERRCLPARDRGGGIAE